VVNRSPVAFVSVEQLAAELKRAGGTAAEPVVVISADAARATSRDPRHGGCARRRPAAHYFHHPGIQVGTRLLEKTWYRRAGLLAWLLWPASLAFRLAVALRRLAYALRLAPSRSAGVPVVVVGNLTVGGSGKTPLVIHVAELLKAKGWSPVIVSRGYLGGAHRGREQDAPPRAVSLASDPAEVGDEPVLMARRSGCPVWVGAERAAVALRLRDEHPDCDVIVMDDGLQHYRLRRDVEIAVVDARGFGNGFMLPAGPCASRARGCGPWMRWSRTAPTR